MATLWSVEHAHGAGAGAVSFECKAEQRKQKRYSVCNRRRLRDGNDRQGIYGFGHGAGGGDGEFILIISHEQQDGDTAQIYEQDLFDL